MYTRRIISANVYLCIIVIFIVAGLCVPWHDTNSLSRSILSRALSSSIYVKFKAQDKGEVVRR